MKCNGCNITGYSIYPVVTLQLLERYCNSVTSVTKCQPWNLGAVFQVLQMIGVKTRGCCHRCYKPRGVPGWKLKC